MAGKPKGVGMCNRPCEVEGCGSMARNREMCSKHYHRWYRHGDPLMQKRATSTPGMSATARKAWADQYKLEHGCADCGYNQHPAALDFDHRPGTIKVRDIKSGKQFGWQALQDEVAKCDVVCANCHRVRTVERRREVMSSDTSY